MSETQDAKARLAAVRHSLAEAAARANRDPRSVRLLAASKAQSVQKIRELQALGVDEFGENYAQEMAAKVAELAATAPAASPPRFVFIGTVQSNKIATIVAAASEIQSVGSVRHARLIAAAARSLGKSPYPIYLLVNAGDETTKSGLALADVETVATAVAAMPELDLQGLMAIPPPLTSQDASEVPELYRSLRRLASRIGRGKLSLGMSGDLDVAIAAGTDCVRIGTALFGARPGR